MVDHYTGINTLANPSFFGNQGEIFAPVNPVMDSQDIRMNALRQYYTAYDRPQGAPVNLIKMWSPHVGRRPPFAA